MALSGHTSFINDVAICPNPDERDSNSEWVASTGDDMTLRLWNVSQEGSASTCIKLGSLGTSVCWAPALGGVGGGGAGRGGGGGGGGSGGGGPDAGPRVMVSERNGALRIFGLDSASGTAWVPVCTMTCAGASPLTYASWCPSNPHQIAAVNGGRWMVWTSTPAAPDTYTQKEIAAEASSHRRTRDTAFSTVEDGSFLSFRWSREDPTVVLAANGGQLQFFHIKSKAGLEGFAVRPMHDSTEGNLADASWHGDKALCVVAVGSRLMAARNR